MIAHITPRVVAHPSHMKENIFPTPFRNHPSALPPINAKIVSTIMPSIANMPIGLDDTYKISSSNYFLINE